MIRNRSGHWARIFVSGVIISLTVAQHNREPALSEKSAGFREKDQSMFTVAPMNRGSLVVESMIMYR